MWVRNVNVTRVRGTAAQRCHSSRQKKLKRRDYSSRRSGEEASRKILIDLHRIKSTIANTTSAALNKFVLCRTRVYVVLFSPSRSALSIARKLTYNLMQSLCIKHTCDIQEHGYASGRICRVKIKRKRNAKETKWDHIHSTHIHAPPLSQSTSRQRNNGQVNAREWCF